MYLWDRNGGTRREEVIGFRFTLDQQVLVRDKGGGDVLPADTA